MLDETAADQASIRRANLSLVLRSVRDDGPRSRARLAADLRLTKAATSSLVSELEDRGLLRHGSFERGAVGRPGQAVELDGHAVCGIGAEINVDHLATFALDLSGDVVATGHRRLDARSLDPSEVLDHLADELAAIFDEISSRGGSTVGVTIGVAGLVDGTRDLVALAPNLGWQSVSVVAMLRDRLGGAPYDISVDNEANLAAIAETVPGDPDRRNMLVVHGEIGVGGGIVADGRLLRGARGYAGELGHMIVDPGGRPCGCGRTGCWETVVGLRALLVAAADPDDPVRDPALAAEQRLAMIDQRARRGDTRTLAALDQVAGWVGAGVAVLANALNPSVVVLSGYFAVLGGWMREVVESRLESDVLAPHAGGTRVQLSTLGATAAVRGGAITSLDAVFTDPTRVPLRADALTGGAR